MYLSLSLSSPLITKTQKKFYGASQGWVSINWEVALYNIDLNEGRKADPNIIQIAIWHSALSD